MLYSQALTGAHQAAPSSSSSSSTSPSTTKDPPDTITTTTTKKATPTQITKQQHQRRQPRSQHQHQQRHNQDRNTNPDYTPNPPTKHHNHQQSPVYILTLTTSPSLTTPLTALRRAHFPAQMDRGNLPAHLTMFHALPGGPEMMEAHIVPALEDLVTCREEEGGAALRLATGSIFRMRRGVGINAAGDGAPAAVGLHAELQRRWWAFLSEQDRRGPWRPHWTVQNKAADDAAVDAALADVRAGFRGAEGLATGCTLWRYEKGGRWTFERRFDFGGGK